MDIQKVLDGLEIFGVSKTSHSSETLLAHLIGTHEILKGWLCSDDICMAGLCHSIYGTESFLKTPATLDNRTYMKELIGEPAERLAYLFGAHTKESLWQNLKLTENFNIIDRFLTQTQPISQQECGHLITLTLANWLEQRPRAGNEHQFLRKYEFLAAKRYLPEVAYNEFLKAYNLGEL